MESDYEAKIIELQIYLPALEKRITDARNRKDSLVSGRLEKLRDIVNKKIKVPMGILLKTEEAIKKFIKDIPSSKINAVTTNNKSPQHNASISGKESISPENTTIIKSEIKTEKITSDTNDNDDIQFIPNSDTIILLDSDSDSEPEPSKNVTPPQILPQVQMKCEQPDIEKIPSPISKEIVKVKEVNELQLDKNSTQPASPQNADTDNNKSESEAEEVLMVIDIIPRNDEIVCIDDDDDDEQDIPAPTKEKIDQIPAKLPQVQFDPSKIAESRGILHEIESQLKQLTSASQLSLSLDIGKDDSIDTFLAKSNDLSNTRAQELLEEELFGKKDKEVSMEKEKDSDKQESKVSTPTLKNLPFPLLNFGMPPVGMENLCKTSEKPAVPDGNVLVKQNNENSVSQTSKDTAIFESPKTLPSGGNIRHSFDSSNAETSSTMPSENTMSSDCQPEGENEVISEAELTKKANNRLADIIASLRKNLNQPDEKKEDSEESNKAAKKTAELFVNKVHLTEIPSFVQDMLSGNLGTEESPVDDDDEKGLIMDDAADNADISDQLLGDLDNYSFKSNSSVSDLPPGSLLQGGDDDEDSLDREISQAIAEDDGKNVDLVDIDSSDFPDVIDLSDDEEEISKAKEMEKDIGVKSGGLSVKLKRSSSNDSEKNELDMQESIQKDDLIVLGDRSPVKISKDIITPKASHQTIENAPVFLSKERDEKEVIPIKSVGEASMDSEDKIEKRTVKQLQKSSENVDINNEILDAVEKSSPSTSQKNFRTSSPKKLEVVLPEIDSFKDTSKSDQDQKEVVNNSSVSLPDTTPELVIDTSFDVTFSEKNSASIDTDASTKESHKVQGEISKELENLAENSKQIKDVCADTSISTDSIVSIDHSTDDIVCISDKDSSSVEVVLVSDGNDSNIKTLNSTEQEAMDIEIVDEINLVNSKADLSIAKSDNKIDEAAKVSKSEDISIGITGTERHESNVTSKNLLSKEEAVKIHEGVVKAQEDSVKIPEDIARLQEDTLKIQEHALKIQEDATKTQEDSSKIEDVAKLQESALKVHEHSGKEYAANTQHEVSKIQENSVIIPEDAAKIQNNAVNIQENIVKIQEDTVKMQEDTAKSQKDATKIPVVSVKSQEDATKIRADVAKIPADAAKIQEDSAKIQEDSAKIQEDSAKIQEGVGKTQEGVQVIPMEIEDIVNIQDDALKIQKDTAGSEENATEISVDAAKSQEDAAKIQEDVSKIQENTTKCPKIRIEIQEDIEKIEEDAVNIQKDAAEFQENDKKVPVGAAKTKEDAAEMPADAAKIQEDTTKIQDLVAKIQEDTVKIPKNSMEIQEDIVKIQEVAAIIHTDAAKSQKDATEIPVNAAKIQEETAKIQEDTTQIREDMAEIQEDTTQIQEDTTQIQEGTAKIQEDVSKIQEDRAKTQEDIAQIQEDAGETPTTTVEIQEDIAKIQEDAVKIQEDTVKSQEDATKILVDAVKSHEDVTKIPVDPVNIPEETAKIPENTVETQEDIAKLQDDSQNIPKETAEIIRDAAKTHENAVKLPEDTAEINEDVTSIHDDTAEFLESASCNKMKGIKTTVGEECIKAISPESNIQSVISDKKEDNNRLNLLDEELMDTEMSVDQESDEAPVIQSMNEAVETTKNQSTNLAPDIIENQRSPQLALEIESPKPDKMQTTHIPSESVDTNILDVAVCPKILDSESITDEVQLSNEIEVVPETSKPCEELKENDKEDRVVESPTSHIKPTEMVEEKESSIASLESGGQYPIKEEIIEENKATNAVSSPKIELEFSATSPENQGPSLDLEVAASQTEDQSSSVDLKVTAPETENQRTAKILEPSLQESTDILKSDLNSLVIPDTVEISAKITKSPDQDPNNALQTDENECVENVSDPIPSSSNVVSTLNENEITTQSKEKSKQIETPAINKDTDAKPVTLTLVQNLKFDETLDKDKNINDLPVLKSVDLKSPETTPNQLIQNSAGNIIKNDENLVSLNEKVAASPKPEDGLIPECEQNISKSTDEPTSHSNLLPVKKEISEPDDIDTRPGTPVLDEPDLSAICKSNECIKKLANLSKISSMDIDTSINESESFAKIPSHEGTPLRDEPNLDGNEKLPNLTELESTNTDSKIIENTELSQGTPVRDEPRITENLLSEESTRSSIIESENKETVSTSQVKTRKMSAFSEISLMKNESPTFLTESPAFLTESPTFLTESTMQVGNKVSVMQMEEVSNSSTNMEGEPKAANLAAIMQAEYHDRLRHVMTPLDASQDAIKFQTRSVETSPQDTKVVKVVASFGKAIKTAISQKPVKTDPLSSNETSKRKLEEKDNQKEITVKKDSIGSEVISKPEKSKEQATSEAASKKGKQDEHSLPPVDSNDAKEKSTKPKETERVVAAFSTNTNLKGFVSRRKELERKLSDLKDDTKLPSTSHHASETDNRNLSEVSESDCLSLSLSDISDPESGEITEKPPMPQPKVSPNEIKKEPIDRPSAPITSRLNFQSNTNKTNMPPLKITIKNEIDQDDLRARLLAKKANAASQPGEENVDRRKRHRKKNHKRKKRKVGNKEQARSPIRYVNEQGIVRNVSVDLESEFSDSSDLPEYDEPYETYQRAKKSRIGLDRMIPTSAIKLEFNENVEMGLECKEPLDKEIKKEYNEDDKYELQRRLRAQLAALEEELNPKPPTRQRSITPPEVYRAKTRDAESPIKLSKSPKISPRSSRSPGRSQRSPVRRSSISPSRRVRPTRRCSKSPKRRSKSPIRLTPLRRLRSPIPRVEPRRGRSRSPKIRLPIKRRSRSPRRRSRSPRRRSRSPKRRSNSPRRRSNSPRRRSNSPRRRLISPKRRSISPRHRSISSRRRSISPRRRSISPRRRSISPRRRPISPKRRSISPRRRKSISPRRRKSISPRRRSISPRRRSRSPRRSPPRRSKSPSKRLSRSPKKEHTLPKRASKSPTKSSQAANLQVSSTDFSKVIQSDLPLSQNLPSVSQVTLVELPEAVESSDTLHLPNPNLIQVPISETIENVTKPKSPPPNPNLILIPISETIEKDTKAETNLPIVCPTVIDVSDSDDDERPPASKVSAKEEEHAKTKESENTKAKEVENVKAKENETAKAKEDENAKAKEDENAKAKEDENAKVKEAEKSKVKEAEKSRAKEAENDAVGFTIEVSDDDEVIEAPPPPIISNDPKRSPKHEVTTQRPKVEATVNDEGHLVILLDDDDDDEDVVVPLKVISSKPTENQSKSAPPTEATTPSNPKLEPISSKREPFSSKGELSDDGLTDEFGSNDFGGTDFEPPSPEENEPTAESVEALKEKDLNELHAIKIKLEREIGISEDILSQLIGNAVEKYSGVPATEYCQPNMEYYPPPNTFMMSTDFYERMQQPIAHVSPKDPRLNRMRPAPAPAPKLDEVPPPPPIPRLTPAVALPPATQPSKSLDYNDDYSDEDDLLSSGSGSLDDDDDAPRSGSSKHDKKFVMVEMSKLEEIIGQQIAKFLEANKVASKTPTKTSTSSKGNKAKKSTTPREPIEDPESPESSPEPIQTKKPRKNALSKDGSGPVHMTAEEIVSDIKKSMASLCKPKSPEKPRKGRPRSRLRNRIESSSDSDRDDASSFPSSSPPKTKISPKTKSPNVEPSALRNKITNDVAGIIKLGKANTATKVKPSPALKMAEQLTEANLLTPLREMPYDDKRKKKAEAGGSKKQKRIPKNTDMSMHCNSGEKNCLLCKEMEKNEELISHYVNVHRENEVYVARLELGQVEALKENPNLVKPVRKSNIEKYSGKCPFCSEEMSCPIGRYMEHFASHTGEFAYECDCCGTRDSRKRDLLKHCNTECEKGAKFIYVYRYDLSNKVIPAYVCIQCNYTQLNSANVIKHIRSEHDQQQVKTSDYVSITLFKVDESEPEENPKAAEEACDNIKVGNEAIAEEDDDYDAYDNFEYAPSPESDTPRPPPVGEAIEYVKNEFIMDAIDAIDWKSLEDTLTEPQELQALPVQSVTAAAPQPTVMNESLHIVPKSETLDQSIDGLKPLDIGTQIFTEIHAMATETPLRIKEISSGSDVKSGGKTKAAIIPVVENSKPPAVEEKKASTGSSSQTTTNRKVKFKGVDNSNPNITRVQSIGIEKTGLNKLKFYCFVLDCNFNPIDSLEEFRKHMRTHRHKWTGQCVACRKKGSKKFLSIDKEFLHLVNDHLPQKSYASKLLRPWIKNDPSDCYKTKDICEMLLKEFHLENLCKCMGPNCVFTTNSQKDLQFHIQLNHSEDVSALYCCYCSEHFIHTNGLVDHIGKVHGASRYQCSKCFYRSCAAYNVQMHQRTFHEDEKSLKIIVCSGQTHTFSTEMLEILDYRQRNVKPLSCPFFSACRKLVFVKHLLLDHIVKDHSRREPMDINSALYDCVYCSFGTTDLLTIRQHMANEHPSQLLYVCGLVFIKSLHPLASQTTIDITSIKSTSLVYIGDIVSKKKFIIKDQSANSFEENSIEAVNHGEDSTALNERIRQMFGEAAITFNDVESYIRKIAEGMQPDTIKTEERSELDQLVSAAIKDTGFVGKELYKCGFPKCERTFDNFEQFDRHISTHAGDKKEPIYRCPHCNRIIPTNQIRMHTIQHRRHRYLCIFCGGSSASQNLAIEHLKMSHQSQSNVFEYLTSDKDWDQKFSEQESRIFVAMPRKHDGDRIEKILEVLRKRFNPDQLADDVPAERPESPVERKEETIIPVFVSLDTRLCCNIDACPFVAKTDEELMQHISERHLIIMSGRYSCAHCPYGLSSAQLKISRIGNHLQYHGPTIVVCNMCNYYHYNRLRVLNHINMCHPYNFVTMTLHARSTNGTKMKLEILYNKKIRSPEDNYKCTLCEAILTECEDFFVHMKENHQLNVRFKCDMCPFFDNNLQAVEDHSKKTHADEPRTRIRSVFLPAGGKWVQNLSPFELLFENYEPVEQESESVKAENTVAPQATENVAKSPSRNSSNQSPVANEPEIKTEGGRKRKMNEPEVYRPGPASKKLRKSGVKRSNSSVKAPEEDSKRIKISTSPDRNTESVSANTSAVLTDTELIAALESDCTPNLAVPAASGPQMKNKEVGLIAFIRSSPKEVRHEEPTEDSAHETSAREEQPEPEVKPMLKLVPVEKLMAVRHNKGSPKAEIYNSIQPAQNNIIVSSPGLNLEISVPIGEILASKANISSPTNLNTTQPTTSVPYHTSGLAIPISPSRITELSTGDTQSSTNTSPRRMRTDVYIICFLCGAKSDSYTKLRKHFRSTHPGDVVYFRVSKKLLCAYCYTVAPFNEMKVHHFNTHVSDLFITRESNNHKKCAECSFESGSIQVLKQHVETQHSNLYVQMHSSYEFLVQSYLEDLLKVGTGQVADVIRCLGCDHIYLQESLCKNHVAKSHQNSTSVASVRVAVRRILYGCSQCWVFFETETRAIQHIRKHIEPYGCNHCEMSFSTHSLLEDHYRLYHKSKEQSYKFRNVSSNFKKFLDLQLRFSNGLVLSKLELEHTDYGQHDEFLQRIEIMEKNELRNWISRQERTEQIDTIAKIKIEIEQEADMFVRAATNE